MDERRRRQAAGRTDRTQSAREIDNNGQERAPRRRGWHTAGRVIGTILLVMVLTMAIFAGIFSAYINSSMRGNVEVYLDEFESKVSTELYYQEPSTEEWTMYQTLFLDSENRIWANLDQIPKNLQEAVVAIEDKRFYKHHGVDWYGTARAILSTLFGGNVQGGSTITQQLVKNVTGDNQNTVKRKVTEIYRALDLEKRYEKDEILEAYLNEVYFGRSCYGVVTASLTYFDKDVSELTLAECASLISITNNPSLYDPLRADWSRENNRERQLLVLGALYEQGTIDQTTYEAAKAEEVVFADATPFRATMWAAMRARRTPPATTLATPPATPPAAIPRRIPRSPPPPPASPTSPTRSSTTWPPLWWRSTALPTSPMPTAR